MNIATKSLITSILIGYATFGYCDGVKYVKTRIDQKNFVETISVQINLNLMFTEVEIEGKQYKFLIDTGAPFAISPELAEKIDFITKGSETMRSSNSQKGVQRWGILKKAKIGNIGFSRITTFIVDLKKSRVLACLDFDGIIGSNVLNTCIWQIHHDDSKVVFSDKLSRLQYTSSSPRRIKKMGKQQAPYIACKVNKSSPAYVLFDTGSGDFFDLKYSSYHKAVKSGKVDKNIKVVTGRGLGASGIYGVKDTTKFMIKLPKLNIAGYEMNSVVADMSITSKSKVGIRFAKGRILTFDFPQNELYIHDLPKANIEREFNSFGFDIFPDNDGPIVSAIWEGSEAERLGVPKFSKVVKINDMDLSKESESCSTLFDIAQLMRSQTSVRLVVDHEGDMKEFEMNKKDLFQDLVTDGNNTKK